MNLFRYSICLISVVVLHGLTLAAGQTLDQESRQRVKAEIVKTLLPTARQGGDASPFILLLRREDLEQNLISLQLRGKADVAGARVKDLKIYEVSTSGYEVAEGRVTAGGVEVDGGSTWLIGEDVSVHTFFHLAGFDSRTSDFNSLMSDLGVKVDDPRLALEVLYTYYMLVEGWKTYTEELVSCEDDLRILGLQHFRSRRGGFGEFNKWWARVPERDRSSLRDPQVAGAKDGFRISLYRYTSGELEREQIGMSPQGQVTHLSRERVCCQ